jgi:hypothetical protein
MPSEPLAPPLVSHSSTGRERRPPDGSLVTPAITRAAAGAAIAFLESDRPDGAGADDGYGDGRVVGSARERFATIASTASTPLAMFTFRGRRSQRGSTSARGCPTAA